MRLLKKKIIDAKCVIWIEKIRNVDVFVVFFSGRYPIKHLWSKVNQVGCVRKVRQTVSMIEESETFVFRWSERKQKIYVDAVDK